MKASSSNKIAQSIIASQCALHRLLSIGVCGGKKWLSRGKSVRRRFCPMGWMGVYHKRALAEVVCAQLVRRTLRREGGGGGRVGVDRITRVQNILERRCHHCHPVRGKAKPTTDTVGFLFLPPWCLNAKVPIYFQTRFNCYATCFHPFCEITRNFIRDFMGKANDLKSIWQALPP